MATQTLLPARHSERPRTFQGWRARLPRFTFLRRLIREIIRDEVIDLGGMMAFYAILALFPMLVFVVTIALLVIDPDTIHQGLHMATKTLPAGTHELISAQVDKFIDVAGAGFAIGSFALALWSASRGVFALGNALDRINGRVDTRSWMKRELISLAVTVAVGLLMVLALVLLVLGPVIGNRVMAWLGGDFDVVWSLGRWVVAGFAVMVVWAVVYHFLPDTRRPFRLVSVGSVVGIAMWLGASYGFNVFVTHFSKYEMMYGTLGSAIAFLTWLWLSNIALLVGAEINDVLARMRREKAEAFLAEDTVRRLNSEAEFNDALRGTDT